MRGVDYIASRSGIMQTGADSPSAEDNPSNQPLFSQIRENPYAFDNDYMNPQLEPRPFNLSGSHNRHSPPAGVNPALINIHNSDSETTTQGEASSSSHG